MEKCTTIFTENACQFTDKKDKESMEVRDCLWPGRTGYLEN